MKILKNIFIFIVTTILTVSLILLIVSNLLQSTILDKQYVLAQFDKSDYYNQIYVYVESNFEKYIYQSGFDKEVIEGLITEEQIKQDTNIILNNIYENSNTQIDVENIRTNLKNNIDKYLKDNFLEAKQNDIDAFINTICNEYLNSISHYKYEQSIYNGYKKIHDSIATIAKIAKHSIIICIVLLLILNIPQIMNFIAYLGVSSFATGIFLTIVKLYINVKIKIQSIMVLNDAISLTIRDMLENILKTVTKNSIAYIIIGLIIIVVFSTINAWKYPKKENEN